MARSRISLFLLPGRLIIETEGIAVAYLTLVKALKTHSIGIGGDSCLSIADGCVYVGPERKGSCLACGGKMPTVMDAFNFLGITNFGDCEASAAGLNRLALPWDRFTKVLSFGSSDLCCKKLYARP
ncbi:hypothetical protein DSUL_150062 [Desulfovibrionales bacterium]